MWVLRDEENWAQVWPGTGELFQPPWVLAAVAPSAALQQKPEAQRAQVVLEDMRRLATEKGCQPHEFPLRVVFVPEVFTPANGLRNANFKLMWTKVRVRASTARTCPR